MQYLQLKLPENIFDANRQCNQFWKQLFIDCAHAQLKIVYYIFFLTSGKKILTNHLQ